MPRGLVLARERCEEEVGGRSVGFVQREKLGPDVFEEDIEVARGASGGAELAQRPKQRLPPRGIEVASRRPEKGARAPGCHAVLVQVLRILAEPDAGS